MTKLKLAAVEDDKPVKLTVALPLALHRDLVAYADIMSRESGKAVEPAKLIAPMLKKNLSLVIENSPGRAEISRATKVPQGSPPLRCLPKSSRLTTLDHGGALRRLRFAEFSLFSG